MYIISGTLFFIAAIFMLMITHIFSGFSIQSSDPILLLMGLISLFAGFVLYAIHFTEKEKK